MNSNLFDIDYEKLYALAKNKREEKALEADLYILKKFLNHNYDAKLFMEDISASKENRKKFLKEIFPATSRIFWELANFVVDRDKVAQLSLISENYTRFLAKKENIDFAEIILAQDVPGEVLGRIRKKLGGNISFKKLINPKILGGFIVSKIDGTIFDASLLGRLNQLKRGMVK